ncbi:hypothetical protein BC936DRAFT_140468 [Jimgerdemannia flammicorona]|uniref:AFG1-like ATPase-domain-containing protein n=1 Tax=Jimgerdemannia flammicorona TaxID=994334 RepID=A0A433ATU5_9FUNG|nr:hypothetical protein BC936DRAFT_140468 [Jimgerdemannia flammicorona]
MQHAGSSPAFVLPDMVPAQQAPLVPRECSLKRGRDYATHYSKGFDALRRSRHGEDDADAAVLRYDADELEQQQRPDEDVPTNLMNEYVLLKIARNIMRESWLICFDEFQMTDIATAAIMKQLFLYFFKMGGVIIVTSNRIPDGASPTLVCFP